MNTSSDFNSFIAAIDQNMPTERGQLIYIYHTLGKMLFKDNPDILSSLYKPSDSVYAPQLFGMIKICKSHFNEKETEVVNYIFQQSVKKLEIL